MSTLSGAPEGAKLYQGVGVQALEELYTEINARAREGQSTGVWRDNRWMVVADLFEESNSRSEFFEGELHPQVDGYEWHRGYLLELEEGGNMVIYTPWIYPQESRAPLVFVIGDVQNDTVEKVIEGLITLRRESMKPQRRLV